MPDHAPVELDCEQGIHALGGGLYRLELRSLPGDTVVVTFPTLEPGFFASPACVTAGVALSGDSTYLADSAVADTVAVLRVESSDQALTGSLEGIFADYVADNGTGQPGPVFVTPRVQLTRIPITRRELSCDCGPARSYDDRCELPTCDTGSCYFASCPAGAAVCVAP